MNKLTGEPRHPGFLFPICKDFPGKLWYSEAVRMQKDRRI